MADGILVLPGGKRRPIKLVDNGDGTYSIATSGGGGGGGGTSDVNVVNEVEIDDAALLASLGLPADAAWTGSGDATLVSTLKSIRSLINGTIVSGRTNTNMYRLGTSNSATIASGATNSGNIAITGSAMLGFIIPAAFTGTAINILVSNTTSGHVPLCDGSGSPISIPVAVSRAYTLPADIAPWTNIILQSNATEAAARTIPIVHKP